MLVAHFITGRGYAQSESGSIHWHEWLESRPVHALDGLVVNMIIMPSRVMRVQINASTVYHIRLLSPPLCELYWWVLGYPAASSNDRRTEVSFCHVR